MCTVASWIFVVRVSLPYLPMGRSSWPKLLPLVIAAAGIVLVCLSSFHLPIFGISSVALAPWGMVDHGHLLSLFLFLFFGSIVLVISFPSDVITGVLMKMRYSLIYSSSSSFLSPLLHLILVPSFCLAPPGFQLSTHFSGAGFSPWSGFRFSFFM